MLVAIGSFYIVYVKSNNFAGYLSKVECKSDNFIKSTYIQLKWYKHAIMTHEQDTF